MAIPYAALIPLVVDLVKARGEKKKEAKEKLKKKAISVVIESTAKAPITTGAGVSGGVILMQFTIADLQAAIPGLPEWAYVAVMALGYTISLGLLLWGKREKL